jgi:hypothetical protein
MKGKEKPRQRSLAPDAFRLRAGRRQGQYKSNEDLTSSEYYCLMIAGVITACGIARIVIPRTSLNRITRLSEVATTTGERYEKVAGIDVNYVEGNSRVKSVSVDGVKASAATVSDKSYKIARPIYMFTRGNPSARVVEFVDFVLGPEGQAFVKEAKLVPVPQKQ